MRLELTPQQKAAHAGYRAFVDEELVPRADAFDRDERTPAEIIRKLAQKGYLGSVVPREGGEAPADMITYGLLHQEIGRGCSSLRSLVTVHDMVAATVLRWGSPVQRERWLPGLRRGDLLGAFALSEPEAGSDAGSILTRAILDGDEYVLDGRKQWITYGQLADLFLIFAQCDGAPAAFLVERSTPGLTTVPISGMLGFRASMLAEIHLKGCRIPRGHLVGRPGFGISHVATMALDLGRYGVAWGSVGIAQACLEASIQYASERKQFGVYLQEHQLVQQKLTDMLTQVQAARLMCYQAGYARDARDPQALVLTLMAKYFASTAANRIASDAVQIHGANGCSPGFSVQRYMRDAKIMEIIEGSTQIQQALIAKQGCQWFARC
ncbi:acyl-CoA dehydrogenase family protein [Chondromyces crocatus]|uniref:Acyl-CoA dehydrogenase n=1 Tax=Chondromyces crocatus TaxID=52 RepID=A0A0K1EK13_CHOCO|nr:acyl-CoA dehydrogenase family protein [Chondromyces crocatus]AKT41194.1 acyl-CoA dehydrogenase [Chondromyces crocatus]